MTAPTPERPLDVAELRRQRIHAWGKPEVYWGQRQDAIADALEELERLRAALRVHHPIPGCGCGAGDVHALAAREAEEGKGER